MLGIACNEIVRRRSLGEQDSYDARSLRYAAAADTDNEICPGSARGRGSAQH